VSQLQQSSVRNKLLRTLTPEDFGRLAPHLEPIRLDLRDILFEAGQPIAHVVFPEQGNASLLADTEEGRFEVGVIGPEGLVGVPVVLGLETSPHTALVQGAGTGLRMPPERLRRALDESTSFRRVMLRFVHAFMTQITETAHANAGFPIEARLARWLLMSHDRLDGDELPLTHEFLSMMLGTRRPGVTLAVQSLEGNRLIRATRGRVQVLDRAGLERLAGDAYGLAVAEYGRAMQMSLRVGEA
jgi:CRP-like cAMP-binding protein